MNRTKRNRSKAYVLLLAALLTLSSAVPAFAADGGGTTTPETGAVFSTGTAPTIGTIKLNDSSYFELKNVSLLPAQGNKTVTFTVTVNNGSSSDLLFIDYWVRLKTTTGNQISVHVLPQDKDKNRITPKSNQDISFYATVNAETELKDLIFEFIKWDFSQSSFERSIGEVKVPDDYNIVTAPGEANTIQIASNPIQTTIKKVYMSRNEKNYTPTVVLTLENVGSRSVAIPGYQYMLRTAEGYMYPLDAKGIKDLSINPKVKKDIDLTGSVPVTVSTEGWQLVIVQNAADLKMNLPIAFYALPQISEPDAVDLGKEFSFTVEDGSYTAMLNSVQRLPWEDQDILAAGLTLSNRGPEALPIPNLTGYFELDDAVKVEAKLVRTDKVIGLSPNASAQFQFVGKIPYTYEFAKVKLILQEKPESTGSSGSTGSTSEASDLLEFVHRSELMQVPHMNVGETHKSTNIGRKTDYKIHRVVTYTGNANDTFAVELETVNQEKRSADVTKLVAHFKTLDGNVYPATVSEIKNKINPGNSALLFLSSNIPKDLDTSGMSITIGEAVTEDKLSEKDKTPDAYVNAAAFWLPEGSGEVKPTLKDLELDPYKLTINRIYTQLDSQGVHLTFDYNLIKNMMAETNTEGRKLIIALEDEAEKIDITKEFDFKDFEGTGTQGGTTNVGSVSDGRFKLGSYKDFKIDVNDSDLIFDLRFLKTYKLNVYDSFQGQKRLLASQKVDWFERTE
ncbi:hypothetical protein ACFQI7_05405 [Paenibacillus allorhizosphaerae]|uniref:Uncharacterized protein n=1 Tax=Paenibacillus allorhizosphaerae TaxID=2849866 RepID=A0ABM8VCC9_9BACL|nr:hypothetical protein [Paenibacillus allorhizosphaerae]CAG7621583.1 hypothetical protein PAECIP111802_00744 [Paenibacillus allorhizosphaerae]